ncbi:hypothetical protein ACFT2C_01545 [Promicromonospora sp. NPDC057138]|uniref:hypothetical protein n=1 Tax=Promicromonospora sp. NPDC057138 TaxID=3346031 RepID=UPI003624DC0A
MQYDDVTRHRAPSSGSELAGDMPGGDADSGELGASDYRVLPPSELRQTVRPLEVS